MAGTIPPIFSKRDFNFAATTTVTVIRSLDVTPWREATLLVRLHSDNIAAGGSTMAVTATPIALTEEDPGTDFVSTTAVGTATFTDTATVGELKTAALSANFGSALRIQVVAGIGRHECSASSNAPKLLQGGAWVPPAWYPGGRMATALESTVPRGGRRRREMAATARRGRRARRLDGDRPVVVAAGLGCGRAGSRPHAWVLRREL